MKKSEIKIIVADDHPIMLNGLVEELMVVGYKNIIKCSNGQKVIDIIEDNEVDVAILDILMPYKSGIDVAKYIKINHFDIKVIFYTYHSENSYFNLAKSINVDGYLLKENPVDKLHQCIIDVINNRPHYDSFFQNKYSTVYDQLTQLTRTEILILKYLSLNLTTKQISELRQVSHRTIEKQRAKILSKLLIDEPISKWAVKNKLLIESFYEE